MRGSPAWRGVPALSLVAGAVLTAVAGWMTLCHYGGLDRSACAPGLAQRLFLGTFYVWAAVGATRLWRLGGGRRAGRLGQPRTPGNRPGGPGR